MQGWVRSRSLALPKHGSRSCHPRSFASGDPISRYEPKRRPRETEDLADDLLDEEASFESLNPDDPFAEFRRDDTATKTIPHRRGRKAYNSNFDDGTWHIRSAETDQNLKPLPLPPFLWRDREVRSSLTRRDYPRSYESERPNLTIKKNLKHADFSTHLAQNPYAAALAKPVRSCTFSGNRLPTSCLIDFHAVTNEAKGTMDLIPSSIIAALVPTRKASEKWKKGQLVAVETATTEEESIAPSGSATYLTCQKQALEFIAEDRRKRLIRMGVSTRMRNRLSHGELQNLHWKEDMPEYVLRQLRRVVKKKLRYWFTKKGKNIENQGVLMALPGTISGEGGGPSGLARLDEVNDVMCVLKLTPTDKAKITPRYNPSGGNAGPSESQTRPIPDKIILEDLTSNLEGENDTRAHDTETEHTFVATADTGLISSTASTTTNNTTIETNPDPTDATSSTSNLTPNQSATYVTKTSWWAAKLPSFLSPITKPLQPAPGLPASTLYFPTVPYRNRRVPLYHLHHMLGEEHMQNLLRNSTFSVKSDNGSSMEQNGSEQAEKIASIDYVVMTRSTATVQVQLWLLKLAGYIAKPKDEPF